MNTGGIVYLMTVRTLIRFQIDDPLNAFAVHGACGMWGVLAAGLFSTDASLAFAGYNQDMIDNGVSLRFAHQVFLFFFIFIFFFFLLF